jgi:hypothetical protein
LFPFKISSSLTCLWITWLVKRQIAHIRLSTSILLLLTLMNRNTSHRMPLRHALLKSAEQVVVREVKQHMIYVVDPWLHSRMWKGVKWIRRSVLVLINPCIT